MLRIDHNEEIILDEQGSIFINSFLTSPKTLIEIRTEVPVESLSGNDRSRRNISRVTKDVDEKNDNIRLTNSDTSTVNRNPTLHE